MESSSVSAKQARSISKWLTWIQLGVAGILLISFSTLGVLYPENIRSPATIHSSIGILTTLISGYLGHRAFAIIRGGRMTIEPLRQLTTGLAGLCAVSVLAGDWLYISYQIQAQHYIQAWVQQRSYFFHQALMDFKPLIGWFPLPLSVAAAFILWQYGDATGKSRHLSLIVGILLALVWMYVLMSLILGLDLTKIRLASLLD
ncbi:hypothetical protein [Chamaesiphon sp. GL140_3_metabinner_50]|uniref:hypothetical protein n=1 Tax=Chamaesiphon sp. GL140_3_metabinner_50 TaxID=2970812 RepID=UPI0025F0F0A7|nr:hypothetical protein [Chamaesiphon sp. GL140_3_metabinner_50]